MPAINPVNNALVVLNVQAGTTVISILDSEDIAISAISIRGRTTVRSAFRKNLL